MVNDQMVNDQMVNAYDPQKKTAIMVCNSRPHQ